MFQAGRLIGATAGLLADASAIIGGGAIAAPGLAVTATGVGAFPGLGAVAVGATVAGAGAAAATIHGGTIVDALSDLAKMSSEGGGSGQGQGSARNPAQDQLLSKHEIRKLQEAGHDVHDLKGGKAASRYDLYKDWRETFM